jgi:hypothetical protein
MDYMVLSPEDAQSNSSNCTPVQGTHAWIWESPLHSLAATDEWEDTMDKDDNVNGSRKSHASHTRHPQEMDATTGGALWIPYWNQHKARNPYQTHPPTQMDIHNFLFPAFYLLTSVSFLTT